MKRERFTEPYTLREHTSIRLGLLKYDIKSFLRSGLWQSIAHKLPRRIAYFAYIRVVAHAWVVEGNVEPDALGFSAVLKHWDAPR